MNNLDAYKLLVAFSTVFILLFLKTEKFLFIYIELLILLTSVFSFPTFLSAAQFWKSTTEKISSIVSKIILSIIFIIIITPLSFIYRIFNQKEVNIFYKDLQQSYFDNVESKIKRDISVQW
jgi:hypothetical protein